MPHVTVTNVRIAGVASAVPSCLVTEQDDAARFGAEEARKVAAATGVHQRRVVPAGVCASDLCLIAARRLIASLNWDMHTVDLLVFVSQTPDHFLPATACCLHGRLGLRKDCAAFDIALGCSGFVYGVAVVSQMLACGTGQRALLLVGDTISRLVSPDDRAVAPLFGDCGTATAIETAEEAPPMHFRMGTDGTGARHLIVPAGAFRQPCCGGSPPPAHPESVRTDSHLFMNGAEVFSFTIREVPPLVDAVLDVAGWCRGDVDAWLMHQASEFMVKHLAKRMRLPGDRVVLALDGFGNTSCASIPLAMTHCLRDRLQRQALRTVLAGFGVGFSWAAAAAVLGPLVMPPLVMAEDCGPEGV